MGSRRKGTPDALRWLQMGLEAKRYAQEETGPQGQEGQALITIEQDADRIMEAFRFFRFPGTLTVSHDEGMACLQIVSAEAIELDHMWLTIAAHRSKEGNAAMRITLNGKLHRICKWCRMMRPFESTDPEEQCVECQKPRNYYKADPIKVKARAATRKAIKEGRLRDEPEACEDCGRTDEDLTIHHLDYSEPLEIEWLCTTCHGRRHRGWRKYYAFKSHVDARMAWI